MAGNKPSGTFWRTGKGLEVFDTILQYVHRKLKLHYLDSDHLKKGLLLIFFSKRSLKSEYTGETAGWVCEYYDEDNKKNKNVGMGKKIE